MGKGPLALNEVSTMSIVNFARSKRSALRIFFFLSLMIFAGMLLPTTAWAQVSYIGAAAGENFGSQALGSDSVEQALSFSISTGTAVGSIAVVTMGAVNLDFVDSTDSTCVAQVYSSLTNCTVNVTFAPLAAGVRMGAVVFYSETNNTGAVLASVPVYGIGAGPQIAFGPGTVSLINPKVNGSLLVEPVAVTMDAAGDLYIADLYGVVKMPAGSGGVTSINPTVNGDALYYPCGVAVDGAGDLFVSDFLHNRVVEIPSGGPAIAIDPIVGGKALNGPYGVAVDAMGDLFIADTVNRRVVEVPAGGGAAIAISPAVNGKGLFSPQGVAVDNAGNLFIADTLNQRVIEVPASGGAAIAINPVVNGISLSLVYGLGVDAAGDLYIADTNNNRIVEVPAGGGAAAAFDPKVNTKSLQYPEGVTADGFGDVFIADASNSRVVELQRAQPSTVNFATSTVLGTTDATDGTATVQVINVGNQPLTLLDLTYPADFSAAGGDTNGCSGSTDLSAGQQCDLPIQFTPEHSGLLNEQITLIDNTQNETDAQQSVALSGTSLSTPATLTSPKAGSTLAASSVTFAWTAGTGVTSYQLLLGATGAGSSDIYNSGSISSTSATAPSVPANDGTVYARLVSMIGGVAQYADYTFVESSTPAALVSPAQGSTLSASNITFTWTAGAGVTAYNLWLGTSGPGSSSLYVSGSTTATSVTVATLPARGATVYARLYSMINGAWQFTDYTFTESATAAQLMSPTPGSTPAGSSVTFAWTAGEGVSNYQLWLGTDGPGSSSLYNSGSTVSTSATVDTLPANGTTVYARLHSLTGGIWKYNDYTYTSITLIKLAALTAPTPNSALSSSNVTFTWSAGSGVTAYDLWLGTSGLGSSSLYVSGATTATSVTVATLPARGATVYARIYSLAGGVWKYNDYTYTEAATPAVLTTPTPGSMLSSSNVTFAWTASDGVTAYDLWLGTSGPGSSSLYASGSTTATSVNVATLPARGATVYARLYSLADGIWKYNDYTYTESCTPAVLVSPAQGSTLSASNITFTWSAGSGVTAYDLWLGTSGAGSSSLYVSGATIATSTTVTTLPARGAIVYARLYSQCGDMWKYNDYTYIEP
jgi:sugar lactone lactonase YvrE